MAFAFGIAILLSGIASRNTWFAVFCILAGGSLLAFDAFLASH